MFLKRLLGVLLGVIIGVIPLLNTLAASFFTFRQQKKKWALFYMIISGLSLVSIGVSNFYDNKDKPVKTFFPTAFQQHLQEVAVKRDLPIDSVEMETILQQVLSNTANQLIQKDKNLEILLQNARNASLSEKPKAEFHQLSQRLYRDYLNQVQTGTGKDKYNLIFDTARLTKEKLVAYNVDRFVNAYLESERGVIPNTFLFLLGATFLIGLGGCIGNGVNLFVKPSETAVVTFSTDVDVDTAFITATAPSFSQPSPQPQRTPPPLPQEAPSSVTVKVNIAGEDELMQLRGINRILAKTIIGERNTGGSFTDINDLKKRIELSTEQVDRIRQNLDFEAPKRGGGRVIEY
ncbi:helix-hairpin-helix domain-containing protein [Chitinophaga sp. HK235]|uniref:ComEA family DNA-binding protein n=1 Tax=Chitinophaga sp. HK235 TaxID=2952571 RepID=UPI001BAD85F6|nr:helix-hairpin-helix domain-containing protein [Chitinophaga sp. HK235]